MGHQIGDAEGVGRFFHQWKEVIDPSFDVALAHRLTDVLTSNSLVDIANGLRLMPGQTLEDKDVCQSPKSSLFLSIVNSTAARKRNLHWEGTQDAKSR